METAEGQQIVGFIFLAILIVGFSFAIFYPWKYKDPEDKSHEEFLTKYLEEHLRPIPPPSDVTRIIYWDGSKTDISGNWTPNIENTLREQGNFFVHYHGLRHGEIVSLKNFRKVMYFPPTKTTEHDTQKA